jgi:hypothetical protein
VTCGMAMTQCHTQGFTPAGRLRWLSVMCL